MGKYTNIMQTCKQDLHDTKLLHSHEIAINGMEKINNIHSTSVVTSMRNIILNISFL